MNGPKTLCLAGILAIFGSAVALAQTASAITDAGHWTDSDIEAAVRLGCRHDHAIEHYRGVGARQEVLGPLWLTKPGEKGARGVVLPPFVRLYLYGRSQGCDRQDLAEARALAKPEIWVVLWRSEDPPNPYSDRTSSNQKVLRPTEVRLRSGGAWHRPTETRTRDERVKSWYGADWNEKESLLAVFSALPHDGSLHVDYEVAEDGRSYLTESAVFSLVTMPERWWAAAHTSPDTLAEGI